MYLAVCIYIYHIYIYIMCEYNVCVQAKSKCECIHAMPARNLEAQYIHPMVWSCMVASMVWNKCSVKNTQTHPQRKLCGPECKSLKIDGVDGIQRHSQLSECLTCARSTTCNQPAIGIWFQLHMLHVPGAIGSLVPPSQGTAANQVINCSLCTALYRLDRKDTRPQLNGQPVRHQMSRKKHASKHNEPSWSMRCIIWSSMIRLSWRPWRTWVIEAKLWTNLTRTRTSCRTMRRWWNQKNWSHRHHNSTGYVHKIS